MQLVFVAFDPLESLVQEGHLLLPALLHLLVKFLAVFLEKLFAFTYKGIL